MHGKCDEKVFEYNWSWESYGIQFNTLVLNSNILQDNFSNLFEM